MWFCQKASSVMMTRKPTGAMQISSGPTKVLLSLLSYGDEHNHNNPNSNSGIICCYITASKPDEMFFWILFPVVDSLQLFTQPSSVPLATTGAPVVVMSWYHFGQSCKAVVGQHGSREQCSNCSQNSISDSSSSWSVCDVSVQIR